MLKDLHQTVHRAKNSIDMDIAKSIEYIEAALAVVAKQAPAGRPARAGRGPAVVRGRPARPPGA